MAMVVYFADHLTHSIQIDAIGKRVELDTLAEVNGRLGSVEDTVSTPPEWAVPLLAPMSGYVQSARPELLLPLASRKYSEFPSVDGRLDAPGAGRQR
jgi:uncharacterized membrane protein